MLYVGRLDNGMDQSLDTELAAARSRLDPLQRAPKARLVFEEVSLVHVLVEHRIDRPRCCPVAASALPAAPRRDEVREENRRRRSPPLAAGAA